MAGYTISMLMWGDQEQVINAVEGRIITRVRLNSLIETFSIFTSAPFFFRRFDFRAAIAQTDF